MKIALDIHDVCDANPEFFAELTNLFIEGGHEIHILTGQSAKDGSLDEIKKLNLSYTHFFSCFDYHIEKGTVMSGGINNIFMPDEIWNRTKGDYCRDNKIDFCIDDRESLLEYFETPFASIKIKKYEK